MRPCRGRAIIHRSRRPNSSQLKRRSTHSFIRPAAADEEDAVRPHVARMTDVADNVE